MPNWCQNYLMVTGATPEFRAWLEEGFSFQRMKPVIPPDSHNQCSAWGTKWDLEDNGQREAAGELLEIGTAYFDTAWNPPIPALAALSRMFPDVSFRLQYCELGMFFAGTATFQSGECEEESFDDELQVMEIARDTFGIDDEETCEAEADA
jgi:hypothetical protein